MAPKKAFGKSKKTTKKIMANSPKQVMDLNVAKGFTEAQSDEHKRNWDDKKWGRASGYGAYDRTRDGLNFEIVKGKIIPLDKKKSIPGRIREILSARGIKDPNEGLPEPKFRTVVNFIFGGSRARMHELAFGTQTVNLNKDADNSHIKRCPDIEKWALDVYRFVADKWGEENIAGFVVHLDETNPHCHCTLLPIKDGRFAFKKIFGGKDLYDYKDYMRSLHDEFAKVNEKWGLVRGSDISKTGARNIPPHEYRRLLSRECADLETQIESDKSLLQQLKLEVSHAERRVKGLTTMISNLENRKAELEQEMVQLSNDLQAGKGNADELQRNIDRLSKDYEKVLDSLTDKRQKLTEASRKLSEYRELEEESKEKANEYRQQAEDYKKDVREASGDLAQQVRFRIADAFVNDVIDSLKSILPTLGEAGSAFDNTLLGDLAERGEEILKCAGLLFAGYVDGATTFAEGHGGGGGGSGLPWGRKDDEDDLLWARRCLFRAAKMMRPSGGKSVKRK